MFNTGFVEYTTYIIRKHSCQRCASKFCFWSFWNHFLAENPENCSYSRRYFTHSRIYIYTFLASVLYGIYGTARRSVWRCIFGMRQRRHSFPSRGGLLFAKVLLFLLLFGDADPLLFRGRTMRGEEGERSVGVEEY